MKPEDADRTGLAELRLHWMERIVLLSLFQLGPRVTYDEIAARSQELLEGFIQAVSDPLLLSLSNEKKAAVQKPEAIAKSCGWLMSKQLVEVTEAGESRRLTLGEEGRRYFHDGLPEVRLVNYLRERKGLAPLSEVKNLPQAEIALGWAKRNGWISFERTGPETMIILAEDAPTEPDEEIVLTYVETQQPFNFDGLSGELRDAAERLLKRGDILRLSVKRGRLVSLTDKGRSVAQAIHQQPLAEIVKEVTQLTPELLSSGLWREVVVSPYDVTSPVPPVFSAKRHPLVELIKLVKQVYVEMGFEEIEGPVVELAFWNFDALFQPQDHPAREMQDTFYLADPMEGELPRQYVGRVSAVHRNGGRTGSKGWGYAWSEREARRLVLRTHTTATTIRHLAAKKTPPIKVFCVDRIYRNERVDWKHLAEFHQIEGIVVEEKANLRQLMGIIKEFYSRLGLREVRFRPSFFPYTEPSAEVEVHFAGRWLELGGMGIFRPEVTWPFGVNHPVLAWGLGLERLAMMIYGLEDIRTFNNNDLAWIRAASPLWPERVAGRL